MGSVRSLLRLVADLVAILLRWRRDSQDERKGPDSTIKEEIGIHQEFHLPSGLLNKILTWFAERYNAHWGRSMYGTQSCGLWRLSQVTNIFVLGIDAAVFLAGQLVRKLANVTQPDRWFCPSIQVSASSQARTVRLKVYYRSSRSYMWTSNLKGFWVPKTVAGSVVQIRMLLTYDNSWNVPKRMRKVSIITTFEKWTIPHCSYSLSLGKSCTWEP